MSGPYRVRWDSLGMGIAQRGADAFCTILEALAPPSAVFYPNLAPSKIETKIHPKNGDS